MFIGHFALGFAGKRLAPKTSLGTLRVPGAIGYVQAGTDLGSGVKTVAVVP